VRGSRWWPNTLFAASGQDETDYLRQVAKQGGEVVRSYKAFSYELLQLGPGMRVLAVGCGTGTDLLPLADRVGEAGYITGLDCDADRLLAARDVIGGRRNVRLVVGNAEQMPFGDGEFDRLRADRVLQHIPQLVHVLSEMWRILRPGGIVTLVEPDWQAITLYPASPAGGDDDHLWSAVIRLCQRRLPHALIGRQLASLFHRYNGAAWEDVQIQARAYLLRSWQVADTVLQIAQLAQALAQEEPALADETHAWLQALDAAALNGDFVACVPLFFAQARRGRR
jgi:ubiquinone/menaquinone biosynthesis C-methylase UbiE